MPSGVKVTSVPFARTTFRAVTWEERLPYFMELPWVPVATAPAIVWSTNHEYAGSTQPSLCFQYVYSER